MIEILQYFKYQHVPQLGSRAILRIDSGLVLSIYIYIYTVYIYIYKCWEYIMDPTKVLL